MPAPSAGFTMDRFIDANGRLKSRRPMRNEIEVAKLANAMGIRFDFIFWDTVAIANPGFTIKSLREISPTPTGCE